MRRLGLPSDLFGLSPPLFWAKTWSHFASQTKVPNGGSCRIYRVTSPRSINPGSDMTSWSHTGWVVVEEAGGATERSRPPEKGEHVREGLTKFSSRSPITNTAAN